MYEAFGPGEIVIEAAKKKRRKSRRQGQGAPDDEHTIAAKKQAIQAREPIDERILANLLRLNLARSDVD